jgi:autotransporter-associated beta strand protein
VKVGVQQKRLKHVLLGAIFSTVFFYADYSEAALQTVTTSADAGPGSLRQAVINANADMAGNVGINFNLPVNSTILLLTPLPLLQTHSPLNMDGTGSPNLTINGASNNVPVFFVFSGVVNISSPTSLTLTGSSIGGAGGSGLYPGGGGMGAGGAAFVNTGATLSLSNVIATGCSAVGGAGGNDTQVLETAGSGGGMLGGVGSGGIGGAGGGGLGAQGGAPGGLTQNGNPGGPGLATGQPAGGQGSTASAYRNGGVGGLTGGGGGSGAGAVLAMLAGGGGGIGGLSCANDSVNGGAGGDFGGGGACGFPFGQGGAGGYGGGAGGSEGGSRSPGTVLDGLILGGTGSWFSSKGADGGAAVGGAYFVRNGGTLNLTSVVNATGASNNTLTGGAGGNGSGAGTVVGAPGDAGKTSANDIYVEGGASLHFTIPDGVTETIGTLGRSSLGGAGSLIKDGPGTLVLQGSNALTGGANAQTINAGILQGDAQSLSGNITNNATLDFTTTASTGGTFSGTITGPGVVNIQANGNSTVTFSTQQSYTGLTTITAGTLNLSAADIFVPANLNNITLTGTSTLSLGGPLTMGDLISTVSTSTVDLGSNGNLILGTANNTTFAGSIIGNNTATLTKVGASSLILSGNNTYSGETFINGGSLIIPTGGNISSNQAITIGSGATLRMDGGTLSGNASIGGAIGSTLLVTGAFTGTQVIGVDQITVNAPGVFTINTATAGFNGMTVNLGGSIILDTNLSVPNNSVLTTVGTFNMNGKNLLMGQNSTLNVSGPLSTNGTMTGDGSYVLAINGPSGLLTANNAVSGYGSFTIGVGGTVDLATNGSLDGTRLNAASVGITNNGILNVNGGTVIAGDIGGNGRVNINSAFTPPDGLAVGTISINNGGTLTTINPITTLALGGGTTIQTGGTLVLNNDLTGDLIHNGALLNPRGNGHLIAGNYTMANTATRTVQISTSNVDDLTVNGNATINGGLITVDLLNGGGDIAPGQPFSVVSVPTGGGHALTVTQLPTVVVHHSLVARFDPAHNGNNLQLVARFIPMVSELNQEDPGLDNMAVVLDSMRGSAEAKKLSSVYSAIDSVETPIELQELLSELAPSRNGEVVAATRAIQNGISDRILGKMGDLRTTGYSAGDMASGMSSYGPFVFGNGVRQGARSGIPGYNANTGGFGVLWDTPVMQTARFGVAAAYGASVVRQNDQTRNIVKINNVTGAVYGNVDYGPLFLDGVMSAGLNYYFGKRNVVMLGSTAISHYQGTQYSAKLRGGFTLPVYTLEISPMATGQYVFMNTGQYTEENAPGVNLTVANSHISNFQIGLGARVAEVSQSDDFLPEIHALYLYDIKPTRLEMNSQFATGGASFVTTGLLAPRAGFNIGGSLTAKAGEDFIFIGGYDFETKKSFVSQSLTLKFRWLF